MISISFKRDIFVFIFIINDENTAAAICIKVSYMCIFMIHGYKLLERKLPENQRILIDGRVSEREKESGRKYQIRNVSL